MNLPSQAVLVERTSMLLSFVHLIAIFLVKYLVETSMLYRRRSIGGAVDLVGR
jgi:hypothetical protein